MKLSASKPACNRRTRFFDKIVFFRADCCEVDVEGEGTDLDSPKSVQEGRAIASVSAGTTDTAPGMWFGAQGITVEGRATATVEVGIAAVAQEMCGVDRGIESATLGMVSEAAAETVLCGAVTFPGVS